MCCRVSSFFCGCADLRKGALIIGIVKLVNMMMRLVVMKTILMTILKTSQMFAMIIMMVILMIMMTKKYTNIRLGIKY